MNILFSYVRLFVFLGSALVGIQVPLFVDQYGKSLESHLIESRIALGEFQDDADRFFGGSLEKLIAHYKQNDDRVFNAGGDSIQSLYARNLMLENRFEAFRSGYWSAYVQALAKPVPDVRKEVLKNYSYAIQLKPGTIAFGLGVALAITLVIELLIRLLVRLPALLKRRSRATP